MKKLLIDKSSIVRYRGTTHLSGVGRSTLSLLKALSNKENLPFKIELVYQKLRSDGLDNYNLPFKDYRIPLPCNKWTKVLLRKLRIKEFLLRYSYYHIPHNTDVVNISEIRKTIFTIHDLMIYKFPEMFPHTEKFSKWAIRSMKECKAIVTCSNSSKNDIIKYWQVPEDKVTVIPWGIDRELFYPEKAKVILKVKEKYLIRNSYFLTVSCSHPRKNVNLTLNAFKEFTRTHDEKQLVLVWNNPSENILDKYKTEIRNGKIIFAQNVNDEELRALYSGALVTIFPSLYEGFGFPILESLACHTPIITCNNSSLAEIGKDMVLYTSESDPMELNSILHKIECNYYCFDTKEVEKYLKDFDWSITADKYIRFYQDAMEN